MVSIPFVVDAIGGHEGSPPEHALVAIGVEDRVIAGFDTDATDVLAVDGEELPVDQRTGCLAEAIEEVLEVLSVVGFEAVDAPLSVTPTSSVPP